ncbi:MAG: class I SAM-dependent methyltransferase [Candidatus Pacebacteria bacterium]|jgi:ubiquinone/menaquinone biosynthesis C-methylase UbiE|nr:class I SAM-dependent methyltransferase [Candidatus Paceibacterota bacterium]
MKSKSFWEKHYKHYDFFQNKLDWYKKTIEFHLEQMRGKKKVLDVGAGSGNLTIELLSVPDREVTAVDSEEYALNQLKEKDPSRRIKIIRTDASKLPFKDAYFDGVVSMFLLPFIEDINSHISEVFRVLDSDGIMSISMWRPNQKVEDGWDLRTVVEKKFLDSKILPKYQKEWDSLLETSVVNANNIDNRNIDDRKMSELITKAGFVDIKFYNNIAYDKWTYFIVARKP